MKEKPKTMSLDEFIGTLQPHEAAILPIQNMTKDEFTRLVGGDPVERVLELQRGSSNRDAVIASVGFVERLLSELLSRRVVTSVSEKLFGPQGMVRDFDLKIQFAFGIGLITQAEWQKLDTIRKIRNRFAHDPDLLHFEHDEKVLGYCRSLSFNGQKVDLSLRDRFIFSALHCITILKQRKNDFADKSLQEYVSTH